MALTLLTVVAFAAIMGGFLLTTKAADTTSTTDTNTATPTANGNGMDFPPWNNGSMGFGRPEFGGGPGPGPRGGRGFGGFGGFGSVEVSAEFVQNVTNIAKSDADVQKLLADGYNITSVRPIIKTVVDAEGGVVTKATSAVVMLQKDTTGLATVTVNIEEAKVTQIVILTRTVIEK
jgi:hypothetical protein